MPRSDDDLDDDDRPRRQSSDDDDDRRARSRRDDDLDDRARRRRFEDEDDLPPKRQKKKSSLGLILGIIAGVLFLLCAGGGFGVYYGVTKVRDAADRMNSTNNLRQVAIACQKYHDVHNGFPTDSYGPDSKPLLSWRVHILPYLGEDLLYRQFNLNEPWDSPNNIRLLNQMPLAYATPEERTGRVGKGNKTYYRGFTSPGAIFAQRDMGRPAIGEKGGFPPPALVFPARGVRIAEVTDGTTNTILAIEAGDGTEWTKPGDLDASPGKPFPPLGGVRPISDVFIAVMVDGSIRPLKKDTPEAQLRAMVTYSGNEIVNFD